MTEPRLLVFACQHCSYAGADLAGINRRQYPPNALVLRVPCSGRVDPGTILRAFEKGADGVLVSGCHPGDCYFRTGNEHAYRRVEMAKKLIGQLGLGPERLRIEWVSASEGERFAEVLTRFTEELRAASPPTPPEAKEVTA